MTIWNTHRWGERWGVVATVLCLSVVLLAGCSGKQVSRVGTDTTIDLSGRWNDTDSRLVADELITDCLGHPWIAQHLQQSGGKLPIAIVGGVSNRSTEHIPVGTFLKDLERALINSGQVQMVADPAERGDLRLEKADQWENASPETVKQLGRELGADYMITGTIETITDEEGGEKVLFYQVDLNLTSIETNLKVWAGQHKIKKYVGLGKYKP